MNLIQLTADCGKWLQALRDETQAGRAQAAAINDGSRAPSEAEVQQLSALYRGLHDGLLFRYGQSASYFLQHGVTLLHDALQAELRDLSSALSVLAQIEAGRRRHEAERWAIQQNAQNYVFRLQSEAHANQVRAHEEHNRRWSAAFNYRPFNVGFCAYCNRPFGACLCGYR